MRACPMPADDRRRNLVAERGHQHAGMVAQLRDAVGDGAADGPGRGGVVEEGDVLRPRDAHHEPQPGVGRGVEDRRRRHRVSADRVDAEGAHRLEVGDDLMEGRKLLAARVRGERAVGHALGVEPLVASEQELAPALDGM